MSRLSEIVNTRIAGSREIELLMVRFEIQEALQSEGYEIMGAGTSLDGTPVCDISFKSLGREYIIHLKEIEDAEIYKPSETEAA